MGSTRSQDNKAIVDRWFTEFWGQSWNPTIVEELGAPDIILQYLLQSPRRGWAEVKAFMTEFRQAFPDRGMQPEIGRQDDYGQLIGHRGQ